MIGFPLLLIPLAIYNIIAFLMRDVSFVAQLVTLPLPSGTGLPVTLSDILLTLGLLLLLGEVIKGARPGAKYLTDHLLSLLVFCGAAAEFVLLPLFGTSTFFLLTLMALVDVLAGIALRARRGTQAAAPAVSRREARKEAEPVVPVSRVEPVSTPVASVPAAAVEAAPVDRVEPKIVQPEVTPAAPSPEVPSPGLQPGDGSHPSPDRPR
ncbi:MAG: hypothetical protein Q7U92_12735 [Bradyrhizobium sp.]|uniref:hypothetical protein n=1 Tax=Bradyrhizobium sp. TaxID=376 RepID=UPI00271B1840|nr:hypothetical protein [Bradyrhizobium sp.]MDO9059867.1 hypothetical protein [Bradyrhizobium sp.]MDP3691253.1 hypothetical protein [Bradyrhizobium sp.]